MTSSRSILHVDMDAFFAAVEVLDDPRLAGKPLLVGHDGPRGVVAAASYEARKFGCHSAQPMAVAKRNCPHAVVVPGRHARYREISQRVFAIFERVTPQIEPLSIDEAFLDVTGSLRLLGPAEKIARDVKQAICNEIGITASVGVAPNKFLAKLASDLDKPDGLTILNPDNLGTILPPLPVSRLWGIGPKSAKRLADRNLKTIGDLQRLSLDDLQVLFGADAQHFYNLCRGIDQRDVVPDHQAKSIGQEETFGEDVADPEELRRVLFAQAEQVGRRLRKHGLQAGCVWVKIRFGNFKTITRQCTLPEATDATTLLYESARGLFDQWARSSFSAVRLIGMAAKHLAPISPQGTLFADSAANQQRAMDGVLDQINQRLGKLVIRRGQSLQPGEP